MPVADASARARAAGRSTRSGRAARGPTSGTTVAGFPNLFMLLGPNTGLGHTSVVFMIESQIAYVIDALRHMDARTAPATIEVARGAGGASTPSVERAHAGDGVEHGGCASWYLDGHGRNSTLWPDLTWRFRRRTAPLRPGGLRALPAIGGGHHPGAAGHTRPEPAAHSSGRAADVRGTLGVRRAPASRSVASMTPGRGLRSIHRRGGRELLQGGEEVIGQILEVVHHDEVADEAEVQRPVVGDDRRCRG